MYSAEKASLWPTIPDADPVHFLTLGYIGRNLALHLHKNKLASEVRLVDKQLPELAQLAPDFKEACSKAFFMQADASRQRA